VVADDLDDQLTDRAIRLPRSPASSAGSPVESRIRPGMNGGLRREVTSRDRTQEDRVTAIAGDHPGQDDPDNVERRAEIDVDELGAGISRAEIFSICGPFA
jgi:hypothetical protein